MSRTSWKSAAQRAGLGALVAGLIGCGGAAATGGGADTTATTGNPLPDVTRPVSIPRAITASSDHALLVVFCAAECEPFAIVDGTGAIVAEVGAHGRAVLDVAPGTATYYALGDQAQDRISGEVTAGGIYYAAIAEHATGAHFVSLSPRLADGRWAHIAEYLADTTEREIDPDRRGELDARVVTPQLRPRMTSLDSRAGEMDATHADERTIHAEDGSVTPP
jgi:hypothetical protein